MEQSSIYKEAPPYESGYLNVKVPLKWSFSGKLCKHNSKDEEDDMMEVSKICYRPSRKGAHNWCDNITGCL